MGLDVYDTREDEAGATRSSDPRPFIGVLFECCGIYARVYRVPRAAVYRGRCPKCLRAVRVRVGPSGVDARFFRAR
jgi:hypothetical protein